MIEAAEIYYFVFGALTLLSGLVGFFKTKDIQSLIVGMLCGLAMLGAGFLLHTGELYPERLNAGLILGLLGTVGMSGQYIPKVMINRAAPQVILMAVLSGVGMLLTLIAFAKK